MFLYNYVRFTLPFSKYNYWSFRQIKLHICVWIKKCETQHYYWIFYTCSSFKSALGIVDMYKGTLVFLATDTSLYLLCHKRCNWQFFLQFLCNADSYILLITKWFSLQTLTAEIGNVLELKDVDKGIDDYRSTPHLTFDQYRYYLSKEVNISFYITCSSSFW